MEISVSGSGDDQLITVEGKWREKGGGWLVSELRGLVSPVPDRSDDLPVTGYAAVHVQRFLRAPVLLRRVELDLEFGDSQLRVRHNPNLSIQLFGLVVPGTLTVTVAEDAPGEDVDVRLAWDQMRNLAMNLMFAPPVRQDQP